MVLELLKKMTCFFETSGSTSLLCGVKTRRPEFLIVFKFSLAESEMRSKGRSEIRKKKKDECRNNAYFCYAVGICRVWNRRRALQSAAENIDYRDLFKT